MELKDDHAVIFPGGSIPLSELSFRTSRSGGPGGQNVNKVESKVELLFDVRESPSLTDSQRSRLISRLKSRIDSGGIFHLSSQVSRSQWENRERVISEFRRIVKLAMKPAKKRLRTRPSGASKEERLKSKKIRSEKKRLRSGRGIE